MNEKIERLQTHLSLIRTCAGWSSTQLGEKLGVTRQMISNLENGRNKMTTMQYHAIRHVLAEEIERSDDAEDTQMLKDVIMVLVDEPDSFTAEQRKQVLSDANLLAPSIVSGKTTRKNASHTWGAVLAGAAIAVAVGAAATLLGKRK